MSLKVLDSNNGMRLPGLVEEDTSSRQNSCPSPTMIGALHGRDVVLRFDHSFLSKFGSHMTKFDQHANQLDPHKTS